MFAEVTMHSYISVCYCGSMSKENCFMQVLFFIPVWCYECGYSGTCRNASSARRKLCTECWVRKHWATL